MAEKNSPQPDRVQYAVNMGLAGFAGTVGFVTLGIVGGSLLVGLVLDRQFDTRPLFTILILLGSVPITIFVMFKLALGAVSKMKPTQPANKEEKTSE